MAPTDRHLTFLGVAGSCLAFGHFGLMLAYWLGRTGTVAPFFTASLFGESSLA
ncbi:hypothetical protein ACTGJ9_030130 [Bradyrhizobium sp. RDM12]